jgi:hypothetical protein
VSLTRRCGRILGFACVDIDCDGMDARISRNHSAVGSERLATKLLLPPHFKRQVLSGLSVQPPDYLKCLGWRRQPHHPCRPPAFEGHVTLKNWVHLAERLRIRSRLPTS